MKKNIIILILLIILAVQHAGYAELHENYMNILQAIEEEILY